MSYATSMTFYQNIISLGTVGRIEQELNTYGGILKEIQLAVNRIATRHLSCDTHEDLVFTRYTGDDKTGCREFGWELCHDGFSSSLIHEHKLLILNYIKELGNRGILDEQKPLVTWQAGAEA